MGMFDTIIVSADLLPVSDEERSKLSGEWMQTKDFNNELAAIHIKDGRLMEEISKEVFLDLNFNGTFRFYTLIGDSDVEIEPVENCRWYEFEAHFSGGNLVNISKIKEND